MNQAPLTVLLIEDNPGDVRLIHELLAEVPSAPVVLECVDRLHAGLDRLAAGGIDAVLLDLALPDSRGLDTFTTASTRAPHVPIIVLTGLADEALAVKAVREGAQDYLVKGQVDGPLLVRALRYGIERKRAEEALQESNRRLEEALAELKAMQQQVLQQERLRALGQMASGIAHDFNNALSAIVGFSELLLDRPDHLADKAKATRYLYLIHSAGKDAANVVRRLREFYRHREESEILLPVNLNQLVAQAITLTRPRWKDQALASGITIHIETDLQGVPLVAGNESELREVLINLIFNAVDALPGGGVITVRTRSDSNHVLLEVSDTGTGMIEEVRQRCLEPFFSTKGECGTGLGLAMVYGIMRRHHGTITIESEPGQGTTLVLRLPIHAEQDPKGRSEQVEVPSRRLHVLVVDDEPAVRELVTEYLTGDGHTVDTATNGREGLEKFQADWFDVVVTDRAMPDMGGDQMAAAIKRVASKKPIILLTGFGDTMKTSDETPPGVDLIVSKPVTVTALRHALAEVTTE